MILLNLPAPSALPSPWQGSKAPRMQSPQGDSSRSKNKAKTRLFDKLMGHRGASSWAQQLCPAPPQVPQPYMRQRQFVLSANKLRSGSRQTLHTQGTKVTVSNREHRVTQTLYASLLCGFLPVTLEE